MSSTQPILIEIYDGDKLLAKQVMHQTKVIIGRILSADFRIQDQRVSRIHALLEWMEDGKLRLTDLASTHGTFVNGERIVEKFISLSDDVSFATLKAKIKIAEGDATLAPVRQATQNQPIKEAAVSKPKEASVVQPSTPSGGGGGLETVQPGVSQPREVTVIRSLKETARTRGVLDPTGSTEELEMTVYWENTILHVDHYRQGSHSIRLGEQVGATYILPLGGIPEGYEFAKVNGQTAELFLHASMKGSVRTQGKIYSIEDLMKSGRSQVTLGGQDIAKIRVGNVNFFMMFVPRPPSITKAPLFDQGPVFWGVQLSLAGLAALFLSFGLAYKKPIEGEVKEFPERYKKILVEEYRRRVEVAPPTPEVKQEVKSDTPEPPKTPPAKGKTEQEAVRLKDAVMTDKVARKGGNEGEGARERGEEGKRGWQNSKNETGITNRPKPKNAQGRVPVRDAPVKGTNEGILSALKNSGIGTRLAKVSGTGTGSGGGGGAQGNDPLDKAMLGVGGGGLHSGRGSGGSGLQGTGTGGGGTAVGVGGLGSKGFGGGATGDGVGSITGKGEFAVTTETVGVTVLGGLSREEIARIVNSHQSEINLCYQRELQRDPRLFGKISLKWVIGNAGRVGAVTVAENATGSAALASCISSKVKTWQFPVPPEGSEANVEWPWIFKPQGT